MVNELHIDNAAIIERAGQNISAAADTMQRTARDLDIAAHRTGQHFDDLVTRFEAAAEKVFASITDCAWLGCDHARGKPDEPKPAHCPDGGEANSEQETATLTGTIVKAAPCWPRIRVKIERIRVETAPWKVAVLNAEQDLLDVLRRNQGRTATFTYRVSDDLITVVNFEPDGDEDDKPKPNTLSNATSERDRSIELLQKSHRIDERSVSDLSATVKTVRDLVGAMDGQSTVDAVGVIAQAHSGYVREILAVRELVGAAPGVDTVDAMKIRMSALQRVLADKARLEDDVARTRAENNELQQQLKILAPLTAKSDKRCAAQYTRWWNAQGDTAKGWLRAMVKPRVLVALWLAIRGVEFSRACRIANTFDDDGGPGFAPGDEFGSDDDQELLGAVCALLADVETVGTEDTAARIIAQCEYQRRIDAHGPVCKPAPGDMEVFYTNHDGHTQHMVTSSEELIHRVLVMRPDDEWQKQEERKVAHDHTVVTTGNVSVSLGYLKPEAVSVSEIVRALHGALAAFDGGIATRLCKHYDPIANTHWCEVKSYSDDGVKVDLAMPCYEDERRTPRELLADGELLRSDPVADKALADYVAHGTTEAELSKAIRTAVGTVAASGCVLSLGSRTAEQVIEKVTDAVRRFVPTDEQRGEEISDQGVFGRRVLRILQSNRDDNDYAVLKIIDEANAFANGQIARLADAAENMDHVDGTGWSWSARAFVPLLLRLIQEGDVSVDEVLREIEETVTKAIQAALVLQARANEKDKHPADGDTTAPRI